MLFKKFQIQRDNDDPEKRLMNTGDTLQIILFL